MPRCRQFLLLSGVLIGVLAAVQFAAGQVAHAQEQLLSRGDENRSQFAGSSMKRVQSYGQPAATSQNPQGSEAMPAPQTPQNAQAFNEAGAALGGVAPVSNGGRGRIAQGGSVAPQSPSAIAQSSFAVGIGAPTQDRVAKGVPFHAVYLNGTNVVGLRNQSMKGVNVRFDDNGNVFIDAPHYEVQYDTSYHPLLPDELPGMDKNPAPFPMDASAANGAARRGAGLPASSDVRQPSTK